MFKQLIFAIINRLFSKKKITSMAQLQLFVHNYCAKETGNLVIKYAQKRLGKIHYNLAEKDIEYAKELLNCQTLLHAQLVSDLGNLIAKLINSPNIISNDKLCKMIKNIHQQYLDTAPQYYETKNFLKEEYLTKNNQELRILAKKTGKYLFELLPMTDNLRKSNVTIFQGQVRLVYIQFLQDLGKKIKTEKLRQLF